MPLKTIQGKQIATASWAVNSLSSSYSTNISGSKYYVPIFNGTNSISPSGIFQSGSFTSIRNATAPDNPLAPDILYVDGAGIPTYNLISAHGDSNNYTQVNVQNFNTGISASSDIVATADNGTETTFYVDMGINGSNYVNNGNGVGTANDSYIYSTAKDFYIGNAVPGHNVTIFNGGLDSVANARVFINDGGSVGINSINITSGNPEALLVDSISGTTYNIITARANVNNYAQINVHNISNGTAASSDIVASNDIATESTNFFNIGINSSTYTYTPANGAGGANDTYEASTGASHYIGSATSGDIKIFTGADFNDNNIKLRIKASGLHQMTGSLNVSGSIVATSFTGSIASASYALTASYAPSYVLTSTTSSMTVLSSSFAISSSRTVSASYSTTSTSASYSSNSTSASYAPYQVSASYSQTASYSNTSTSASYSQTASYALNYVLSNITSSMTVASASIAQTASYAPNYVLNSTTSSMLTPYVLTSSTSSMSVISSSYAATASYINGYVLTSITSSMAVASASYAQTASYVANYVLTSATSSMTVLSSSFAVSSSRAVSASFASTASYFSGTVISASYSTTASYALVAQSVLGSITSASYASTASYFSGTVVSASYSTTASYALVAQSVLGSITSASYASTASYYGGTVVSASYALSASWAPGGNAVVFPYTGSAQITGSLGITGSLQISQSIFQYSSNASITAGNTGSISSFATSSYAAGFFDYVATSGTNARAGIVFTVWNGANIEYTETSTNDIGTTSGLILSASLSGANVVLQGQSTSGTWSVKTLTRMI